MSGTPIITLVPCEVAVKTRGGWNILGVAQAVLATAAPGQLKPFILYARLIHPPLNQDNVMLLELVRSTLDEGGADRAVIWSQEIKFKVDATKLAEDASVGLDFAFKVVVMKDGVESLVNITEAGEHEVVASLNGDPVGGTMIRVVVPKQKGAQ